MKYPKGWNVIEHLDEMTEVYIGHQSENFGFTIVRFNPNRSLENDKKLFLMTDLGLSNQDEKGNINIFVFPILHCRILSENFEVY